MPLTLKCLKVSTGGQSGEQGVVVRGAASARENAWATVVCRGAMFRIASYCSSMAADGVDGRVDASTQWCPRARWRFVVRRWPRGCRRFEQHDFGN